MEKINKRSDCPISYSLDIFGDKWSLLVIRDMLFRGKFSFNEFKTSEEKMATNILADRLAKLESEQLIFKEASPKNKSKFIYQLTQKGLDLMPVLISMIQWGDKYNPDTTPTPKKIIKAYKWDPQLLITAYQKSLAAVWE
ncbi:MAG: transcriptional regulator [Mucilaginibacter sp.]|nr:transcriptional regulator [Mucilaginibacter sp.]